MGDFTHCRVARGVRFFGDPFRARYGLADYDGPTHPTIFHGCYNPPDYKALLEHQASALVLWCGGDILRLGTRNAQLLRGRRNIHHIAMSKFLALDLHRHKLPYKRVNLYGSNLGDLEPALLGDSVYVYLPKRRHAFFGAGTVAAVRKALPKVRFVIANRYTAFNREQLLKIYREAAIGLRLTKHDGCANTVLELGMMGRYCVHNGDQPNAIKWRTTADIVAAIRAQVRKKGRSHKWMVPAMREFLREPVGWLTEDFWR